MERLLAFNLPAAPGHLLRRNHQRSLDLFTKHVGTELTRQQFALMLALGQRPGASQRDIVDATGIDKSTIKEMLGRMVARGWIKRARDTSDARAWTLELTPKGLELVLDLLPKVERAQRDILAPLSATDRETLLRCLRLLLDQ